MGGHEREHDQADNADEPHEIGEVDESRLTPDETFDPAGTVDALSLDELDELEAQAAAEAVDAHLGQLTEIAPAPEGGDGDE